MGREIFHVMRHLGAEWQVNREAAQFLLEWIETQSALHPQQVILFRKKIGK
jgi:hypothetical protein